MIDPEPTIVGIGIAPNGKEVSVTHNFGIAKAKRMAGGVVFADANGNAFYDPGEGRGGGTVRVKGMPSASASVWRAGAYALALPHTQEITLVAELGAMSHERTFPAGTGTIGFSWRIPTPAELGRWDALMRAHAGIGPGEAAQDRRTAAAMRLWFAARSIAVDAVRAASAAHLLREAEARHQADRAAAKAALSGRQKDALRTLSTSARTIYAQTPDEPYWSELDAFAQAAWTLEDALAKAGPAGGITAYDLRTALQPNVARRWQSAELRTALEALAARLQALPVKR